MPIIIHGTYDSLPRGFWVATRRVDVDVQILPAVEPGRFTGDAVGLMAYVQGRMTSELQQLRSRAGGRLAGEVYRGEAQGEGLRGGR